MKIILSTRKKEVKERPELGDGRVPDLEMERRVSETFAAALAGFAKKTYKKPDTMERWVVMVADTACRFIRRMAKEEDGNE